MVYRLSLVGKIKGRDTPVTSNYSWPEGITMDEAKKYEKQFADSFDIVKATFDGFKR